MRVLEIITESKKQQVDELDLKKVGTAVGKGVSAATQGLGAVAGGVAGLPGAFKKGFRAGKSVVGGDQTAGKTQKNRTFQYTDPQSKQQSTISVDSSGMYYKVDANDGSLQSIKDPAELSAIRKQDIKKPVAKTGSKVASTGSSTATVTTPTVNPEKLTLKQIKTAVDKMRKRDRDSLLNYLQSKATPAATATPAAPTPNKPTLSVAV